MTAARRSSRRVAGVVLRSSSAGREDPPRLVDLAHVRRRLAVRVQVGMEPLRKATMGAGNLLLGGIASDPEHRVGIVVGVVWHCADSRLGDPV